MSNSLILGLEEAITDYITTNYIKVHEQTLKDAKIKKSNVTKHISTSIIAMDKELVYKFDGVLEPYIIENEEKLRNRITVTKKRWYDKTVKKDAEIDIMVKSSKLEYKVLTKKKYKEKYGSINPEKYNEALIEELSEWRTNSEKKLIEFPYLLAQGVRMRNNSFKTDIDLIMFEYIKTYVFKHSISHESVITTPMLLLNVASNLGHTKKLKEVNSLDTDDLVVRNDLDIVVNNKAVLGDMYQVSKNSGIFSFITEEASNALPSTAENYATVINNKDLKVFSTILDYIDVHFFVDRSISFKLETLSRSIYGSEFDTKKNKKAIMDSLYKLSVLNFQLYYDGIDKETYTVFGLIDYLKIEQDKNSVDKNDIDVKVSIALPIAEQIIQEKTIKMFRKSLETLDNDYAKSMVFKLQADRIVFLSSENIPDYIKVGSKKGYRKLNIEFFEGIIYIKKRYRYRYLKIIEEALDNLVKNKLVIQDYYREQYDFHIKYLPISEEEREKLLTGKDNIGYTIDNIVEIEQSINTLYEDINDDE